MKDDFDPVHCRARDARFAEIGFDECDATALQMVLDVALPAARKIVHNADFRAALEKRVNEMRTDERCATSDENLPVIPDDALPISL
jgi:hypothetical protein